jgi:hypothetical protein
MPGGPVAAGATVALTLAGASGTGVPAGASVVLAQVTVTGATAGGYLSAGATLGATSNINYSPGQTTGNLLLLPVDSSGAVHLVNGASAGSVQVIVDVVGYAGAGAPTATYEAVAGTRLADSRLRLGLGGPMTTHSSALVQVIGAAGSPVPAGASAVLASVTATAAQAPGYLAPGDGSSGTSTVNLVVGQTVTGLMVLPLDSAGRVRLFNGASGSVQVILDVQGYLS